MILLPSGWDKSIAIDFFPQLTEQKYADKSPSFSPAIFQERVICPLVLRFSTLITSAPRSAKNWPTLGPASTEASSRTFKSLKIMASCKSFIAFLRFRLQNKKKNHEIIVRFGLLACV